MKNRDMRKKSGMGMKLGEGFYMRLRGVRLLRSARNDVLEPVIARTRHEDEAICASRASAQAFRRAVNNQPSPTKINSTYPFTSNGTHS